MKICPRCQKTYSDDNLNFCLEDGSVLTQAAAEPPPTMINQAMPTQQQQTMPSQPSSTAVEHGPAAVFDAAAGQEI
ncbi:MAG: hypothetical protein IPK98_13175 [Chloracidobacterium sp.]|nr:hypothetical protein [Chloracidobacterium sp.]